jgi:hypothetical protein
MASAEKIWLASTLMALTVFCASCCPPVKAEALEPQISPVEITPSDSADEKTPPFDAPAAPQASPTSEPPSKNEGKDVLKSRQVPPLDEDEGIEDVPGLPDFKDRVHALNTKILLKEIEFAKFNIHFKQQGNVQGRWRGLRYFASQETSAAMTMSGLIGQIVARERSLSATTRTVDKSTGKVTARPRPLNRTAIQRALCSQMIGQQIGSLGALTELGINYYHSCQAKKNGYDRASALKKAVAMRQELESLLEQRQQLVDSVILQPAQREILKLEGEVLKDICVLTFDEYKRAHIGIARFRTFQNSLYMGDFAKHSVGWTGNLLGIISQGIRNPVLNGPNGICVTISGAIIVANPIVSRALGKLVEVQTLKKLNRDFGDTESKDLSTFQKDAQALKSALAIHRFFGAQPLTACEDRIALYETENISRQRQLDLAIEEIRAGQRSATQNILGSQILGNTKMANGITLIMSGYEFPRNPRAAFPLTVSGQIAYMSGSAYTVADNIRIQFQAERARRRLRRKNLLPVQVYGDRLKALGELEKRVQSPL